MLLTRKCYDSIASKLYDLRYKEAPRIADRIDECRSNGSIDDNPEYYQAIEEMTRLNAKIDELSSILSSAIIFTDDMKRKDVVTFASTVEFDDLETGKHKKYTLLSEYDSDASNGIISVTSPFGKEMLGLHTGEYFSFNENEYVITNIYYSYL